MKFLFLITLSLSLQAQILTFNPFSNKIFQWNGRTFSNVNDSNENYSISFSNNPNTFQAPVALSANEFYATTNNGKIYTINLETLSAKLFYQSEDQCQMALYFSGCIYSLTLTADKKLLFLLHQQNGSDTLMSGPEALVTNIPAPSGPIWVRPNGNIGLLPYGHGIYEIALPETTQSFEEVLQSEVYANTMAAAVMEANLADGNINTYIFDFSTIKLLRDKGEFTTFTNTLGATFDPCFGHVWYLDETGTVTDFDLSPNPAACPITSKWSIEEKSSSQGSPESDAHRFWDLPQGTAQVPNTMVFSLGYKGSLTLIPSKSIRDSEGIDIRIFENAFIYSPGKIFFEAASVELYDGLNWISTDCDCSSPSEQHCAGMQATTITPGSGTLAWREEAGGFGINLSDYKINSLEKIRLIDCGSAPNSGSTGGFDLDAIAINPNSLI